VGDGRAPSGRRIPAGILRIFDSGAQDAVVYAALEIVEGEPLDDYLSKKGKLKQDEAVELAIQIVEALDHVHTRGYVHRDLKPGNLMRTSNGKLVLMDFGTAVKAGSSTAYEVGLYGTVAYLSPEQIEQRADIDGRADLYAAGILLYRMVTGERPFNGLRDDMLAAHLHTAPALTSASARISPELEQLISECLAKSPVDRPASAAEVLERLRTIEETVEPEKPGLFGRLFGWGWT
jgi:serine/threonine-protein kinase